MPCPARTVDAEYFPIHTPDLDHRPGIAPRRPSSQWPRWILSTHFRDWGIGSRQRIGSTSYSARWATMNRSITLVGVRASLGRKT